MRAERVLSVGIDVGTSTTQCVFSALTLENRASDFSVPRVQITKKDILYRGETHLTPLRSTDTIDEHALEHLIRQDFGASGVRPSDIAMGAVIITGETARKRNARAVTEALSDLAGEFVVATAGPALESVLAGRGSGAAQLSEKTGKRVLNIDIGGGTANMALFDRGEAIADGCVRIGGRLLRFEEDDKTILQVSEPVLLVARDIGLSLQEGEKLPEESARILCKRMVSVLEESAGLRERTGLHDALVLEHALPENLAADVYTFSGGVADCIYGSAQNGAFHDLGSMLGEEIAKSLFFTKGRVLRPGETSHATVIGAGAYSVSVTGSTISYRGMELPLKGIPAARVLFTGEGDLPMLRDAVLEQQRIFGGQCALCMEGVRAPSFALVEHLADALADAMKDFPVKIIILKEDMSKALGQALSRRWGRSTAYLCIDGISPAYGDLVDIGAPLSGGRVLPVIVKTFAFSQEAGG